MPFHRKISLLCFLPLLLIVVSGCDRLKSEPIRIGFIGGLTGRTASLGIAGRDGSLLAVEQVNLAGGINGRKIELIIKDDQQDETAGLMAVGELIAAKIPVIVGPMTSSMAMVMVPVVNQGGTLLVSPTASTRQLGNLDDNFVRVYPQCMDMATALANYVVKEQNLKQFAIIYDLGNRAFTEDWKDCFASHYKSLGGEILTEVSFVSGGEHSFSQIVAQALTSNPAGLLILANSLDTAMFSQQVMKMGIDLSLFASEWSMTRDLLQSGGRSVEEIKLFHTYNEYSKKPEYLEFKKAFGERFGREPSFPAIHAYDAMQLVIAGLRKGAQDGEQIKNAILNLDAYNALQGSIKLNRYGDIKRDLFLTVVQEGEFKVLSHLSFQ